MPDVLEKQMKSEETMVAGQIAAKITDALNGKEIRKKADDLNATCGGWPYPHTKPMMKLYEATAEAAWKKMKSKYSGFVVDITVETPSNKPPRASAKVRFDGDWKGGVSRMIKPGETLASICKTVYGHECYAEQVLLANEKEMGGQCKVLPAGYGLEFPRIWVPAWKNEPKATIPPLAKKKAVKVALPGMQAKFDIESKSAGAPMYFGNVIVFPELEGKAEVTATKQGFLDASFNLRSHEAELKKGFGPIEAGFKVAGTSRPGNILNFKVGNAKLGGLTFTGKINVVEGTLDLELGTKPFKTTVNKIEYEGTITLTLKLKVVPNPRKAPERTRGFEVEITAKEVVVVTVVVGVCILGGWAVVAGGAAVKATALGGGLLFATAVGG